MNFTEAKHAFEQLFSNQLTQDDAKDFLIQLYNRGENYEEIAAAVEVMRSHSIKLPISKSLQNKAIDVVGTGGDQSGSINISSTVAIILSSLGVYVAKHGNRSITSNSGSADMLEALGLKLDLSLHNSVKLLEETGFVFMFAQNHHPAMKHIMPIRKSIPHRTIFNLLGPLTNPADVKHLFIGLYDRKYNPLVAQALMHLNTTKAIVVSSFDGLDEVSIGATTFATTLEHGKLRDTVIDPLEFRIERQPLTAIRGGDAKENAQTTLAILDNTLQGPKKDIILLNTAVALMAASRVDSIAFGLELAKEAIASKKALHHLHKIIAMSNQL